MISNEIDQDDEEDRLILVIRVARCAIKARANLGANACAVPDFEFGNLWANTHNLACNLMSWNERLMQRKSDNISTFRRPNDMTYQQRRPPTSRNGVDIRAADTAEGDFDVNIVVVKMFGCKLNQLKFVPFLSIVNTRLIADTRQFSRNRPQDARAYILTHSLSTTFLNRSRMACRAT